jgi:low affinity Fe/Cu permease
MTGTPHRPKRSRISLLLSALDRVTTRPWLAALVLMVDLAWVGFSVTVEFAPRLEVIFQTLVAAATLAMVFVIQHTQARQQTATQRKLDEILRALPDADNRYLALEHAPDPELHPARESHDQARDAAVRERPDQAS